MLFKKELIDLPLLKVPNMSSCALGQHRHALNAAVVTLPKSGSVFFGDFYEVGKKGKHKHIARFFSDANLCYVYIPSCGSNFRQSYLPSYSRYYGSGSTYESDTVKRLARSFFVQHAKKRSSVSVTDIINSFAAEAGDKRRDAAWKKKYGKMNDHFHMYPKMPSDIDAYCDKYVFKHTYIFIGKSLKKTRKAECCRCKEEFTITSPVSSGAPGVCPKCGVNAVYRGDWYIKPVVDKANICIVSKVKGQILYCWTTAVRKTCSPSDIQRAYSDYYLNLCLNEPDGQKTVYTYAYTFYLMYKDWTRKPDGTFNYEHTHIYSRNLSRIFGKNFHNVNLSHILRGAANVNIPHLVSNLEKYPATEIFLKNGLTSLASSYLMQKSARRLSDFGINKQYLPLYRAFNVNMEEHEIISSCPSYIDAESFSAFRSLNPNLSFKADISAMLRKISLRKFTTYFSKQLGSCRYSNLNAALIGYDDYISMSETLGVDISHKSVRFPSNLKLAHNIIVSRFNENKEKLRDAHFQAVKTELYGNIKEYANDEYCIVFPQTRQDFIIEGQSLNHCVGSPSYFDSHINGEKLVFFIRKSGEPAKPFITMQIDMAIMKINQIYGFGDSSVTPEIRSFANYFLLSLKRKVSNAA